MVRLCGAALGLLAFTVTILVGLSAGNPVESVLQRAVWALFAFCVLGLILGWVAYRVIDEYALRMHKEMFPSEEELAELEGSQGAGKPKDGQS